MSWILIIDLTVSLIEYVEKFASASALEEDEEEESSDDEMSSVGSFSDDEEPAGKMEV